MPEHVKNARDVQRVDMKGQVVAGVAIEGQQYLWRLLSGERLQVVESFLEEGFYHGEHRHPQHETVGYVVTGRLQMVIDGQEYDLGPGDAWRHGVNVPHWTRAREDTRIIAVHSPPREQYDALAEEAKQSAA
jgi:quercetin dioxygenase-like cupin family protein